jgi:hypothetical protein
VKQQDWQGQSYIRSWLAHGDAEKPVGNEGEIWKRCRPAGIDPHAPAILSAAERKWWNPDGLKFHLLQLGFSSLPRQIPSSFFQPCHPSAGESQRGKIHARIFWEFQTAAFQPLSRRRPQFYTLPFGMIFANDPAED